MKQTISLRAAAGLCAALVPLCCPASPAEAAEEWKPVYHPKATITRAAGEIRIDAVLDDPGWQGATRIGGFAEHNPGDQTKPEVDTEVLIAYDDINLYVAWICYDDPAEVRASFCERDNIFSDDYVILTIDPYGEASFAYEISANPYGIPGDLLYSAAYGEDITYDMIYESHGRITEDGWIVEMAIPFRGLRFPKRDVQSWRMDFWRNRPRESRFQYSWAAYDRDESCWPCQWGTVEGIEGVEPGAGLELLPAVVAYQSGALDDDNHFENGKVKVEPSLGITYNISSELTAEATINPDFSQVESDVAQLDVNSTFALFYPEKRPFFQEGSDLFNTYFNAVYTRQINDPLGAAKMTYRNGSNSLAYLGAYDEHSIIIMPFEEESRFVENGKSWSNIVRFRHDLGEQSHLGFIGTDRRFDGGGSGSLAGIDGHIRLSESNAVRFQAMATHTEEVDNLALVPDSAFNASTFDEGRYTRGLDGEAFWGHALRFQAGRSTADYEIDIDYQELSPTFRADNGFQPSNNYRQIMADLERIVRFEEHPVLESIYGEVSLVRKWNFDGDQKDEWINANVQLQLRAAQTNFHGQYLASNELFHDIYFGGIWQAHVCGQTQPWGQLRFGGNYNYGHRIARHELVMGAETSWGAWADVKPIDRLLISGSYSHIHSDGLDSGERLFSQSVFRSTVNLQFSRRLSLRLITQYNDRWDTWDVDPLITYRVNSLSVFYIGSTHDYRDLTLAEDGIDGWTLTERQFFLKFQYLFQL
jgi:hypothetical protein